MMRSMLEQLRDDAIDQCSEQTGCLKAGYLFVFECMLDIRLDPGEMTTERTDSGITRNAAAFLGKAGQGIG